EHAGFGHGRLRGMVKAHRTLQASGHNKDTTRLNAGQSQAVLSTHWMPHPVRCGRPSSVLPVRPHVWGRLLDPRDDGGDPAISLATPRGGYPPFAPTPRLPGAPPGPPPFRNEGVGCAGRSRPSPSG